MLEMFLIVTSLSIWASELANKCILFYTDNLGLVDVINKKTKKDNKLIVLLRELVLQRLKHNILFRGSTRLGCSMSRLTLYRAYRSRNSSPWDRAWTTNKR